MLTSNTRITDIKPDNRVKTVSKLADGSLAVVLNSGRAFTVSKDAELFQAFVVYSVLAEL